ncbi:RES domain-containing protein [Thomasclavelia spiroformis]|uniref:RES domain-containing protein n=1 Tax=Thomasclavelia spiroformis TaxID=29348 RepID=UPI0024327EF6|nr:RES domain-containing protein [Thomasclavelia spiroformis]
MTAIKEKNIKIPSFGNEIDEYNRQMKQIDDMWGIDINLSTLKLNIDLNVNQTLLELQKAFDSNIKLNFSSELIPPSIFQELKEASYEIQKLSLVQQMCLTKFLPLENKYLKNKLKTISKKDAEELFHLNINYNTENNRFYDKRDNIIGLNSVKQCIRVARLFDDITADEMVDFLQHAYKHRMLLSKHPVGEKIYENCKKIKKEYLSKIEKNKFYRAREAKNLFPYTEEEMRKAPFGISPQGRFNLSGNGIFYVTDDKESACNEVKKHSKHANKIQIAEFVSSGLLYVLDIRDWNNEFIKFCNRPIDEEKNCNKEYIIPNYLADCLRFFKIDGILYRNNEGSNLYAFFEDIHFKCENSYFYQC